MSESEPLSPAGDGRDARGRFGAGNKAGKGNPLAKRAQRIRAQLLKSASPEDVRAICKILVENAKTGDLQFIREWLDRCIGKPVNGDVEARLAALEALLSERQAKPWAT